MYLIECQKDKKAAVFTRSHLKIPFAVLGILFYWLISEGHGGEPRYAWEVERQKTVEAAKKEGKVTVYGATGRALLPVEAGVFQKEFPEIKVVTVGVVGNPVPRILAERRAGKFFADVAIGGYSTTLDLYRAKALDSIKDAMILPEVLDESKWWRGKHRYLDSEREYAFVFIGYPDPGSLSYSTHLVKPGEIRSFWDFLNPKWKGRIEVRDIRTSGVGNTHMRTIYYHPDLGPKFIHRLFSEMEVTLFRDVRQGVDWLATRKFAICFYCPNTDIVRAQSQGLPVDVFGLLKEPPGMTSSSGNIGILKQAPHPNAAKVLVNWLLSREGQLTVQEVYAKASLGVGAADSLRVDIPKDVVPPSARLREGVDYVDVESQERMSMGPILKIVNEALARPGR